MLVETKQVDRLIVDAQRMGFDLGAYVYLKASGAMNERKVKTTKKSARTQKRIDRVVDEMREQGASGKEISKKVFKAKNYTNYNEITDEQKTSIREKLMESERLDDFLIETEDSIIAQMELNLPYDMTHQEMVRELVKVDFRPYFGMDAPMDSYFDCRLIEGNFAWFHKDPKTGICRYFTREPETKKTFGLSWFDLVELVYGYNAIKYSRNHITRSCKINYKEGEWEIMQELKYYQAIEMIMKAEKIIGKDYPDLYKYIKSYLPVLLKLVNIGLVNIVGQKFSVKNESVFFSSSSYISDFGKDVYDGMSIQKVNQAINIFATLGFLKKAKEEEVPQEMVGQARDKCGDMAQFNNINFYTLPMYCSVLLKQANERVQQLKANKVRNKELTRTGLVKAFGEDFAYSIYGQAKVRKKTVKVVDEEGDDEIPDFGLLCG